MGQLVGKVAEPLQNCGDSMANLFGMSRKRKRRSNSKSLSDTANDDELHSPKKRRLLTTTQYIYQALFKDEKGSDVSVLALGKVWKLHKVYLCQSPYFYSMFNGSWRESSQDFVHIKILDDRITICSLDAVFGSLYSDEIEIDPRDVVSVLATATLFHLDGIIDKCGEVMNENINGDTCVEYYEAACQNGCMNVKKAAFQWLETNLLCTYLRNHKLLAQINVPLMTHLISSPDLYVMQTEFSLYTMLRTWLYLRLHPEYEQNLTIQQTQRYPQKQQQLHQLEDNLMDHNGDGNSAGTVAATNAGAPTADAIQSFLTSSSDTRSFLLRPEGQQFVKPFQALRTQYLTNHHMDLNIVMSDNIIPKEWLHMHVLSHWTSILKVDHLPDEGPQNVDTEDFLRNCMRCGRILLEPGYQKWRWTGFNFGLDLILIADSRVLSIRRHHRNEHERLLSLQTKRRFMIRTSVSSINAQRQPIFVQKSEITSLCLEKNQEVTLMVMDAKMVHPVLISVNLLVVPPVSQSFKEELLTSEERNTIPISEIGTNCDRSVLLSADDSAVCVESPANVAQEQDSQSLPSTQRGTSVPSSVISTASNASSSSSAHSAPSSVSSASLELV